MPRSSTFCSGVVVELFLDDGKSGIWGVGTAKRFGRSLINARYWKVNGGCAILTLRAPHSPRNDEVGACAELGEVDLRPEGQGPQALLLSFFLFHLTIGMPKVHRPLFGNCNHHVDLPCA